MDCDSHLLLFRAVAFGWIVIALAMYALNAQAPPELNRYFGEETPHGTISLSRAAHASLIMALASGIQVFNYSGLP